MSESQWRGVIAPLNTPDAAGRKIKMSGTPKTRMLPLPLRYAAADWGGHMGAVSVGSIDRVWIDQGLLWGEGRFDTDDVFAADVVRKIRMGFVRHMSADIEPGTDKLMAATIVPIPAFEQAQIVELMGDSDQEAVLVNAFSVVGDLDLPFASRDREWDEAAASARVAAWAGGNDLDAAKYRRAFFYQDEDSDPALKGSYKLGYADVIDGTLTAVPRGIFAAAGGHGVNAAKIPESDKDTIRRRISDLYRKMGKKFDDPSLVAPWDKSGVDSYAVGNGSEEDGQESVTPGRGRVEALRCLAARNRVAYALAVRGI